MKDRRRPQQRTGSMVRVGSRGGQGLDDEARLGKPRMMLISGCIVDEVRWYSGGVARGRDKLAFGAILRSNAGSWEAPLCVWQTMG